MCKKKKTTYTFLWQEKSSSFFFQKSREKSLKILLNMHGHCKHNSVEEASEANAKDCLCHCRDASGKLVDSDIDLD